MRRGFTLIELIVVVVIIGLLAAIAVPKLGGARQRAAMAAVQSDMNQLRTAMEMYYERTSTYQGTTVLGLISPSVGVTVDTDIGGTADVWTATLGHVSYPGATCAYDSSVGRIDCVMP